MQAFKAMYKPVYVGMVGEAELRPVLVIRIMGCEHGAKPTVAYIDLESGDLDCAPIYCFSECKGIKKTSKGEKSDVV